MTMVAGKLGYRCGLVLSAALLCISCTHEIQSASQMAARPAVTRAMSRQTINATDAGEGDLEVKALRKRLAANAKDLDARLRLAKLYVLRGFPDVALEHYRLAAVQFPDSPKVALALAKILREMGEREEALNAIREYLASRPSSSWALLSLEGILEDEQGRFAEGEKAHRAALAVDPDRASLHNNLGYNLLLQRRPEEAPSEFRRAIEIDPRSKFAHNNLAAALEAQKQPASDQALIEWQRAADPAVAHNNLAATMIEQGRYSEARGELESALRLRRDFPEALANLRLVEERDGQPVTVPAPVVPSSLRKKFIAGLRMIVGDTSKTAASEAGGKSVTAIGSTPQSGSAAIHVADASSSGTGK